MHFEHSMGTNRNLSVMELGFHLTTNALAQI